MNIDPARIEPNRWMLLLCGVPMLVASLGCCSGAILWMLPHFLVDWWTSDGLSWLGWALIYGMMGLLGLGFAVQALSEARTLVHIAEPGGVADLTAWASAYRRSIYGLAVGGLVMALCVLGGAALMCLGVS